METENKKLLFNTLVVFVAIVLIGFLGYYFGFLGTVYNIMMPERLGAFPLIMLSIIFGIAAFFSPCAFTVLPGYVAHFLTAGKTKKLSQSQTLWQSAYIGLKQLGLVETGEEKGKSVVQLTALGRLLVKGYI